MAPRKRILPNPLPDGCILTDTEKKKWRVGKMIGKGGFGLIYLASRYLDEPVQDDTDYVVKVEYLENGPLFSELKFYQRAAKPETINKWKRNKKLDFLGIPAYFGSGLSEHNGTRYRFMVMERLGSDLQKVLVENGGQLKKQTVLQLGCLMLDVLEYIHDNEYVHADIKAANLLLGHRDPGKVYLADYGLSYRYCPNGEHKDYKENPKKGHNGTIEYTSIDAHRGAAPSRRGDLEVLGYCLLHWQCGTLPWLSVLKNPVQVQEAKANLTANLPNSVIQMSTSGSTSEEVARFLLAVRSLGYKEKPDYRALKTLLWSEASSRGPLDLSRPRARATEAAGAAANGKSSRDRAAARSTAPKPATEDDCTNRAKVQSTPAKVRSRTKGEWTPEQTQWKPKTTSKKPIRSRPVVTDTDEHEEDAAAELVPPRYHPKTREGTKQRQKQEQFAPVHGAVMRTETAFTPRTKLRNVPGDRHGFGSHVNDRRERSCYSWEDYHTRPRNEEEEEEYWGKPMQAHNHWEEDQYTYDYSSDQHRYSTMNSTDPQNQSHVFMRSIRTLGFIVIIIAVLFLFVHVVIIKTSE